MQSNKGRNVIIFLYTLFLSLILFSNFVSAGPVEDIKKVIDTVTESIKPIFELILGSYTDSQYFFASVLILIIIFSVIWVALDRIDFFSENRWILWLISITVSILATRWVTSKEIIEAIILPYSTLGIAISAGLPFVLYFIVVDIGFQDLRYKFFRKVAWIFFAVIFIGLWIARYEALSKNNLQGYLWIYPVTAALSIVMGFADGTIQRILLTMKLERSGYQTKEEARDKIKVKLKEIDTMVADGIINPAEAEQRKKRYRWQYKYFSK